MTPLKANGLKLQPKLENGRNRLDRHRASALSLGRLGKDQVILLVVGAMLALAIVIAAFVLRSSFQAPG